MPIDNSGLNSIQMVPIEGGGGLGLDAVGRWVYFSIMATVGRAENVIFLRLRGQSDMFNRMGDSGGGNILLGGTIVVAELFAKIIQ